MSPDIAQYLLRADGTCQHVIEDQQSISDLNGDSMLCYPGPGSPQRQFYNEINIQYHQIYISEVQFKEKLPNRQNFPKETAAWGNRRLIINRCDWQKGESENYLAQTDGKVTVGRRRDRRTFSSLHSRDRHQQVFKKTKTKNKNLPICKTFLLKSLFPSLNVSNWVS